MKLEDRFDIESPIHVGQIATSYPARQKGLDRKVLLKVIHPQWADDEELVERFNREGKAIAQIDHPNVVRIYEYGQADGVIYLALQWIEGGTLEDRLKAGPLDQANVIEIAAGILSGLGAVHEKSLVHRDLKPDNIMIGTDGRPRLADFSLAGFTHLSGLTGHGALVGSPAYMAPELVEGSPASPQSDLYGLGIILLEALTGSNPFKADDPVACLELIRRKSPPRLTEKSNVNADVARLVDALLERNPTDRPSDAEAALAILQGEVQPVEEPGIRKVRLWEMAVLAVVSVTAMLLIIHTGGPMPERQLRGLGFVGTADIPIEDSFKDFPGLDSSAASVAPVLNKIEENKVVQIPRKIETFSDPPLIPTTGSVMVIAKPWAEVYLDGERKGVTPLGSLELKAGSHLFEFRHDNLPMVGKSVKIEAGKSDTVMVDLKSEAAQLQISAAPWGYLWIDGDSIGILPRTKPLWISPGQHLIMVDHPEIGSVTDTVAVKRGDTLTLKIDLKNGTMIAL